MGLPMSGGELLLRLFGGAMLVLAGLFVWLLSAWLGMWVIADESEFNSIELGEAIGIIVVFGIPTIVGISLCSMGGWYLAPVVARRKVRKSTLLKVLLGSPVIAACSIAFPTAHYLYFYGPPPIGHSPTSSDLQCSEHVLQGDAEWFACSLANSPTPKVQRDPFSAQSALRRLWWAG
jgi:hypothetical protein